MNLLQTPVLYGLGIATLVAGLFAGVQTYRLANERADHAETKADHADVLRNLAELTAKAVQEARQKEQGWIRYLGEVDAAYLQEIENAKAKGNDVADDLRAGNLRLREQWRGCPDAAGVPGIAASAGEPDGGADLRATGAGDLVRVVAACDAHVRGLQAVAEADRS